MVEIAQFCAGEPKTLPWLQRQALQDVNQYVRQAAVEAISQGWAESLDLFAFFQDCAIHDPFEREEYYDENPRHTALGAIAQYYPNRAETLPLLRERAAHDPDEQVREMARRAIQRLEEKVNSEG